MDFQSLPRKDLQILCKKNNIRANMTNAAMADALQALNTIEGIEDIQQLTKPETAPLLPESPKRTAVRSTDLPRTCGRTSNRRKPIKDLANPTEDGPQYPVTCGRTSNRRKPIKDLANPKEDGPKYPVESPIRSPPRTRRGTAAKSSTARRRTVKEEEQEKEEHVDLPEILAENNRSEMPKTPTARNGRKRATAASSVRWDDETHIREEKENENRTAVGLRTYSTRRSSRLSEKIMQEEAPSTRKSRGRKAAVKIASLSVESEDSEKELKEGFEKSDVQEEEQGASIKHVSEVRDEDLALEDAATVIPVEDVSGGNRATVLDSSHRTESCNLESEKFIEEDLELRDASTLLNHETEIGSEKSDAHPTESFSAEDDAAAVISVVEASDDNHAAVPESSLPTESCNLESEKFNEEDLELRKTAIESEESDEDPTESSVTEDDAVAPGGNQAAALESSPSKESCNLESEKCDPDPPMDSSVVENQTPECEESEQDSDADPDAFLDLALNNIAGEPSGKDPTESSVLENQTPEIEESDTDTEADAVADLDLDVKNIASGLSGEVPDDIAVESVENPKQECEKCDLDSADRDWCLKDATDQVPGDADVECEKCDLDSADRDWCLKDATDQVPGDADVESLVSHLVENQVVQIPGDVDLESLVSLLVENLSLESGKCNPDSDAEREKSTANITENQILESEICDSDADQDMGLKASSDTQISVEESGNGMTDPSSPSENLNLEYENCDPDADAASSDTEISVEESGNGMTDCWSPSENLNLEHENCDPDADAASSDTEISVEEYGNGMTDRWSPSENLNLEHENCDPDADAGLHLGVENATYFFSDEIPLKNLTEGVNSGTDTMAAYQIPNSENFNADTGRDTRLKSIIISTIENLVVEGPATASDQDPHEIPDISTTEESADGPDHPFSENPKHSSNAIPDSHENPNIPAIEIDRQLPTSYRVVSQTPMSLRSNRADASDSGKMSGNESLRQSLSNKKWTPIKSKILEDADKENSVKMSGNKSNQSLRQSLSNKKWTPIKSKILQDADKENNNAGADSGKGKLKEFGSLKKVKAVVVEDSKGEDSRQKSLKKKSLRRLKFMYKEKISGNANNECMQLLEKRSALQTLSENRLSGNADN